MTKILRFLIGLFSWLLIGSFAIIIIMTLITNFNLFRGYRSFLVQSGSMEPSIMMGDVVITSKTSQYYPGEVVTFLNQDNRTITHRIIDTKETNNGTFLITKGDANQGKDRDEIQSKQILGKIILVVPKLGFVIAFTRTPPGFALLVIIPALIITFDEIKKIFRQKTKSKDHPITD